ncbi:MAG TPA: HWE histidine kinase domain-containing protein [Gemmatimonadaceae bacterium]|nr:HWE histidine kinase domain-containing protein [Gemmatimonadaceae bacterium]
MTAGTILGLSRDDPMNDAHELRAAIDLVGLGRYRSDPQTQAIQWDARLKAMWGLAPDASVDLGVFLAGIHPEDRDRVQAALGQSVDPQGNGVCDIEYRVIGVSGGAERWVATRGKTVFEDGQIVSFHGVVLDISERKRAEQANLMLIAELEHRTRNLLAVVDSLAEQTLASCESLEDFAVPFRQRLATLSRVQGLLSRAETSPVTIGEVVRLELHALGAEPDGARVTVEGPDVPLPPRSVQILALGLHELATNARKYGALSTPKGSLSVRWHVTNDGGPRMLRLHWAEDGIASRQTTAPHLERVGLGRTLIEQSIPFQLDAQTRLVIAGDSVRCDMSIVIERMSETRPWDALR